MSEQASIPILVAIPWAVALLGVPGFVIIGLLAARASASEWLVLLSSPFFLAWKLTAYFRLFRGFDPNRWVRSERAAAKSVGADVDVFGITVSNVTMDEAVERLSRLLGLRQLVQVVTVNLDFLVSAQRNPQVREIMKAAELKFADGAPVLWLARLLGYRLPERVAGADLVPKLLGVAAERGSGIFLLGGENGAAAAAAAQLRNRHPDLVISGILEPPRSSIAAMDNQAIVAAIDASGADILLVAFGHPKQEQWISLHRDQLSVSIAIGVGCVFDLMAGRVARAPARFRAAGLEWLYRLCQEPLRLSGRYAMDASWLTLTTLRILLRRAPRSV